MARKTQPSLTPAAVVHSSIHTWPTSAPEPCAGVFPPQDVEDDPAALALLDLLDGQAHELVAPQPAAEEESQNGAIALAFPRVRIRQS
jgi:hypothetical protein